MPYSRARGKAVREKCLREQGVAYVGNLVDCWRVTSLAVRDKEYQSRLRSSVLRAIRQLNVLAYSPGKTLASVVAHLDVISRHVHTKESCANRGALDGLCTIREEREEAQREAGRRKSLSSRGRETARPLPLCHEFDALAAWLFGSGLFSRRGSRQSPLF